MISDNKMIDELRKAYDNMTPEQIDENMKDIDVSPLSAESEQRIKSMISDRIKSATPQKSKKFRSVTKKWVAVAAVIVMIFSVAAFNSEAVMAAVAKLFSFIPGVGVVENGGVSENNIYILDDDGTVYKDDMLEITVKGAFLKGNEMELRYTVYLSKITDADLLSSYDNPSELYNRLGYDKYFAIADESPRLTPQTKTIFNGTEITADKITVTETESLESIRTICITHHYELPDTITADTLSGSLSVGDAEVAFNMKKVEPSDSAQGASGGQLIEVDGVKLLCVPTLKDNILYMDYYACELGEYASTSDFGGWYLSDTLTVGGEVIEYKLDESCIFDSDGTSYVGNRVKYDLSDAPKADEAILEAYGLFVDKEYEGKGIFLDVPPTDKLLLNETVTLNDIEIKISEICHSNYGESDGYEKLEHGYLELRYSASSLDAFRFFVNFDKLSINGQSVDSFCIEQYDDEYDRIIIPLNIPCEDVRSIEFDRVTLMLQEDISISIPLKTE